MSMASSGHFAQKSQHWRKIHIDQWDEGWRGGRVEGQSAINSDLHPRSSAKGESGSVSRENQQKLNKTAVGTQGSTPGRQGKSLCLENQQY